MSTEPEEKSAIEVKVGKIPMAPRSAYGALAAADEAFRTGQLQVPPPTVDPPAAPAGPGPGRSATTAIAGGGTAGTSPISSSTLQPTSWPLPPGEVVLPPTRVQIPASQVPPAYAPPSTLPAPASGFIPGPTAHPRTPDETLFDLIQLLHRLGGPQTWSPVERALVVAARAAFEELSADCAQLLQATPVKLSRLAAPSSPPSAGTAAKSPKTPKRHSPEKSPQEGKVKPPAKPGGSVRS